jgi:hypothetical protein
MFAHLSSYFYFAWQSRLFRVLVFLNLLINLGAALDQQGEAKVQTVGLQQICGELSLGQPTRKRGSLSVFLSVSGVFSGSQTELKSQFSGGPFGGQVCISNLVKQSFSRSTFVLTVSFFASLSSRGPPMTA